MTALGILGVSHDHNIREKYGLTLDLMKELILEFQPDVICGEVLPQSWDSYLKDPTYKEYWGTPASEYWELIFPLCEEEGIRFVPVDWAELDVWKDFDPFHFYPAEQRKLLEQELSAWNERKLNTWNESPIPFNSNAYDIIAAAQYDWLHEINADAHNVRWVCRHQIMIQRITNAMKKYNGKRILCIAGADHNHCYYRAFKDQRGLTVIYPLR